jgi:hypothetical protein
MREQQEKYYIIQQLRCIFYSGKENKDSFYLLTLSNDTQSQQKLDSIQRTV